MAPDLPSRHLAAQRLGPGSGGNSAVDRIAELAARLVGSTSAQVSLLSDVQTIAGGSGLAPGAIGSTGPLADSLCTVTATSGRPLVVPDAPGDDRVNLLPPVSSGAVGSYLGVPLHDGDGQRLGALCVFDSGPHEWTAADVVLLEQLAPSVVAALELAAISADYDSDRTRWELAVEAAGVGTFDLDVRTGTLDWDDHLLELFGYTREEFDRSMVSFDQRLHPADLPRVRRDLQAAIDEGSEFDAEYRVLLPDGGTRWVTARGRALVGEDGATVRVLGAAHDTTARVEGEARVARVLESMSTAFFSLDRSWRFSYVNAQAERVLDSRRERLLGGELWELFPAAVGSAFETQYRHAMETGETVTFDAYYPEPLDAWYEVRAWASPDGLAVYFLDITDRRRAQAQAELATSRAVLLAQVTEELASTLDPHQAAQRLTRLLVPALADWCVVTLVGDQQQGNRRGLRDAVGWHTDPALRDVVQRYAEVRLLGMADDSLVIAAMTTSRSQHLSHDTTKTLQAMLAPGAARDLMGQLSPEFALVMPLIGREGPVGLLSMCHDAERGDFTGDDVLTLEEVSVRAGLALDNARLYRQQRQLAEELQRSLLTPPPETDRHQIVVRYTPAGQAAQVGGDWYDAFVQRDGATTLVIGDVVGHDTVAAAAMGQVRTLVRGIAATTGAGPAEVLGRVDEAMETLLMSTTATALVLRLEQTPQELADDVTGVVWSNAGHPTPLVLHPDRSVTRLKAPEADLLLGVDPSTRRSQTEAVLRRGAVVLLYTDGLVERRGQSLDVGLELLQEVLADLGEQGLDLDDLCDQVLARMLDDTPEDDVALVAVQLHVPDRRQP